MNEAIVITALVTFICTLMLVCKANESYYSIKKDVVHTRNRISFEDGSIWEKVEDK